MNVLIYFGKAEHLNIGKPVLPRKRKALRHSTEIGGTGDFHTAIIDHYRVIYLNAMVWLFSVLIIDLINQAIKL